MTEPDTDGGRRESTVTDGPDEVVDGVRLILHPPILEAVLLGDVQTLLGRLLGREPVETFGDWVDEVRRRTGGGPLAVEDLCHSSVETPHRGEVDGQRYYFRCFYDAVILSALTDHPVDIRTVTPGGDAVEVRAAGTAELDVTPDDAVFSFGVDTGVQPPAGGEPTPGQVYAAVCPYVRAFADRRSYEDWAARVSAATVALPPAGAIELAAALVD